MFLVTPQKSFFSVVLVQHSTISFMCFVNSCMADPSKDNHLLFFEHAYDNGHLSSVIFRVLCWSMLGVAAHKSLMCTFYGGHTTIIVLHFRDPLDTVMAILVWSNSPHCTSVSVCPAPNMPILMPLVLVISKLSMKNRCLAHVLSFRFDFVGHISERSLSTKLKLNESTKRNAWLSFGIHHLGGQPTVRSVMLFGVIDIFAFLHVLPLYF